jgi:energy-coupling factor transporter ATP-binding protein EcfA2
MNEVVLENIGPISKLAIPLPEGGGVVVLQGPNGSGKTTALDAVEALANGGKAPALKDGEKKGRIEGLGVKLNVGASTRRSGSLEVLSLDGKLDVSDLVDPGIASPEAADARRIKALIALSGQTATADTFGELFPGGADALEATVSAKVLGSGDPLEIAGAVKRCMEKTAREFETAADNHDGRATTLAAQCGDVTPDDVPDAETLRKEHGDAVRAHMQLESERKTGLAAADRDNAARQKLDELRAKPGDSVEECQSQVEDLDKIIAEGRLERDEYARKLAECDACLVNAESMRQDWERRRTFALDRVNAVLELESAISQGSPAIPTEEQIAAARTKIDEASARIGRAALLRQQLATRAELDLARSSAADARKSAEKLRGNASAVDDVLSDMVSRLGVPLRVKVVDAKTRLVTTTDRGEVPFSELSAGERWRMALDIAVDAVGSRGLLPVKQEAWEGLDPDNRAAIADHCRKRGVWVVTAAAAGGDEIVPVVEGGAP